MPEDSNTFNFDSTQASMTLMLRLREVIAALKESEARSDRLLEGFNETSKTLDEKFNTHVQKLEDTFSGQLKKAEEVSGQIDKGLLEIKSSHEQILAENASHTQRFTVWSQNAEKILLEIRETEKRRDDQFTDMEGKIQTWRMEIYDKFVTHDDLTIAEQARVILEKKQQLADVQAKAKDMSSRGDLRRVVVTYALEYLSKVPPYFWFLLALFAALFFGVVEFELVERFLGLFSELLG